MNRTSLGSRRVALCAALAATTLFALTGCETDGPQFCTLDFSGPVSSTFGDESLDRMLEATGRFSGAATAMDVAIGTACNNISEDLGFGNATSTVAACDNAAAAIDAVFLANSMVTVLVDVIPGVCSADLDAAATCTASCDASFDATATPPTCTGGELSGSCSGTCSGSCTLEGMVACTGSCNGSCSGTCDATVSGTCTGTCTGQCDGTCSAMAGDGSCMGDCTGTCKGTCTGTLDGACNGTCDGMCNGACRSDLMAMCIGTCTGMCDVMFTEPRCEGGEVDVMAEAECAAACEAEASFDMECTDPQIIVTYIGPPDDVASLDDLIATLEANYGAVLTVAEQGVIVAAATVEIADTLQQAALTAINTSVEASDCVRLAIEAQAEAAAKVDASVEASVTITVAVGG